jgi:hypothetical protein
LKRRAIERVAEIMRRVRGRAEFREAFMVEPLSFGCE